MLNCLKLNNFLLVKSAQINFCSSITALTGETGAGKSILINALSLVLGARGSSNWIGTYGESTEITAVFDSLSTDVLTCLQTMGIEAGDDLILRRILAKDGKTKAFINDTQVTVRSLKTIGEKIVDIYGQHSHYALLKPEIQREKLDLFGGCQAQLQQLHSTFAKWQDLSQTYQQLQQSQQNDQEKLDLLKYQLQELTNLDLKDGEFFQLELEHSKLSKASELLACLNSIVEKLYSNEQSAISMTETSEEKISQYIDSYPQLENATTLLAEALVHLHDSINEVKGILANITVDPEKLAIIEHRISTLFDLSRKHNCEPNQLFTIQQDLQQEFEQIESGTTSLANLAQEISVIYAQLENIAGIISTKRQEAGQNLSVKVTEKLQDLGMGGAKFSIELKPLADNKIGKHGKEQINFLVQTNPGLGFSNLNNSASGGELSRLGLAVQICSKNSPSVNTLVMDEVDAGIGGKTASMVGEMLKQLAENAQVICVTHLPQIASIAKQNIKVDKQINHNIISHSITTLAEDQRVNEIARMLSGAEITEQTVKHAEELLANS